MAYPDPSPRGPLMGPGSPPRPINGPTSQLPPPAYAPRTMLPPSPSFPPRYSQPPPPLPNASPSPNPNHDARTQQPPHTRPGSSMSILSMLGSDSERPQPPNHLRQPTPTHHPSSSATSMSLGAVMSPPQQPVKTSVSEYTYKPRSQTPDRMGFPGAYGGTRPYRSSSGTMMQRPSPLEHHDGSQLTRPMFSRLENHTSTAPELAFGDRKPPSTDHNRRSSINAILQPQDVAPQTSRQIPNPPSNPPFSRYGRVDTAPHETTSNENGNGAYRTESMANGQHHTPQAVHLVTQQDGSSISYDTRPPSFGTNPRTEIASSQAVQTPFMSYNDRASSQPMSPETRRQHLFKINNQNTSGLSSGPLHPYTQPDPPSMGSQTMARQESNQSQYDRNVLGDRARRRFSPFASSGTSQHFSSAPPEDRNRKGSDESSQHRAILGLAGESKRGRYSPLPQAVHGAQAQTPTPDAGIKDEHGRVFSGIGSGIINNSSGIATGPPGLSASPFKRDEGVARLSEDNLMKISRSTPGVSKRPRKMKDEEDGAEREEGRRVPSNGRGGGKRSKYSHYNLNGEELTNALSQPRSTPVSGLNFTRRTATPNAGNSGLGESNAYRPQQQVPTPIPQPQPIVYKPHTTIKISSVIQAASRKPRRHLGFFLYSPKISVPDNPNTPNTRLAVTIEPNLLPSFENPEHVNCTYTIRVSRTWLRAAERQAICTTKALWGSGIFTDDSDPIAAAIHSGFIKASYDESIDVALLENILKEQNPKIDGGLENVPETPVEPPPGKDCQITLVVMPTLESYGASVRWGIRSRRWPGKQAGEGGSVHDGVSFCVQNVKWVDDRGSRGRNRHTKRTPVGLAAQATPVVTITQPPS